MTGKEITSLITAAAIKKCKNILNLYICTVNENQTENSFSSPAEGSWQSQVGKIQPKPTFFFPQPIRMMMNPLLTPLQSPLRRSARPHLSFSLLLLHHYHLLLFLSSQIMSSSSTPFPPYSFITMSNCSGRFHHIFWLTQKMSFNFFFPDYQIIGMFLVALWVDGILNTIWFMQPCLPGGVHNLGLKRKTGRLKWNRFIPRAQRVQHVSWSGMVIINKNKLEGIGKKITT